jgi:hypothetical protein
VAAIRTHAEYATDVIEDDGGVREGACEIDRVGQLRMILPGLEAQPEPGELGEPFAEFGIARQVRRNDEVSDMLTELPQTMLGVGRTKRPEGPATDRCGGS